MPATQASGPTTFGGVTPVFRVHDVRASVDYYVNQLGFKLDWEASPGFASVSRHRCCIFLCEGDQGHPGAWVWIGVGDAQAVFEECRKRGARVRHAPTNYAWAYEMQVEDPDGNVLRIGSHQKEDQPIGEWLDMDGVRWLPVPEGGWRHAEMDAADDPVAAFLDASVWHGTLDRAEPIRVAHPEIAGSSIYAAAVLGDEAAVRRLLAEDPGNATAKGGPRGWDALTYLCFSKYLRLDRGRSEGFVRAAEALLDAGASATTGFWEANHQPAPEFESALYGAAGVAHHAGLTRLLVERGADPNDEETPYHSPETHDNEALKVLVESGKVNDDSLATMLLRKCDWHDVEGARWLVEHGAGPNRMTRWGRTALDQAVLRDNSLGMIEMLLDHGANARRVVATAARRGRGDLLALFERRGSSIDLNGVERLISACARGDSEAVRAIAASEPGLAGEMIAEGGKLLGEFAGNGNTAGVGFCSISASMSGHGSPTAMGIGISRKRARRCT